MAVSLHDPLFLQPFVPTALSIRSCSGCGRFSTHPVVCTTICLHRPLHPELFVLWPFRCATHCFYSHSSPQSSPSGAVLVAAVSLRSWWFVQLFVLTALYIRSCLCCGRFSARPFVFAAIRPNSPLHPELFSTQPVVCTTICRHGPLHPELFVLCPFLCATHCFYSHSSPQPSSSGACVCVFACVRVCVSAREYVKDS